MDRLAELIGWETDGRKGEENRAFMRRIYEHLKQQQINADRNKLRREVDNRATRQPVRIRPGSKNLPPAACAAEHARHE